MNLKRITIIIILIIAVLLGVYLFLPINNFKDVERYLIEKEVISNEGEI